MKVELTGLKIKTSNGTHDLTIDEAKELYRQLHELFGEKVIQIPSAPIIIDRFPTWPVYQPIYFPEHNRPMLPSDPSDPIYPTITCRGNNIES